MKELIYFIAFHFEKKRKGDSYNYNKHVVKYEVDFFFFFTHSTFRGIWPVRVAALNPPCLYHFSLSLCFIVVLNIIKLVFLRYYLLHPFPLSLLLSSFSRYRSFFLPPFSFLSPSFLRYIFMYIYVPLVGLLRRNFIARARARVFYLF